MKATFATILCMAMACHHAGSTVPGERILERGGEVRVSLAQAKLEVSRDTLSAWGVIEVPDGSRMQASYAGADAIARSELLKFVRVRIFNEMTSTDSSDPARVAATDHTLEAVDGQLRRGRFQHAWERVERGEQRILRVWSRITVPRADVQALVPEL